MNQIKNTNKKYNILRKEYIVLLNNGSVKKKYKFSWDFALMYTDIIRDISLLKNLAVKGLMTMPPYFNAPEKVKPFFKTLREP